MPETRVRVAGSGFTTFNYNGKPIAFLTDFRDSGQAPRGAAAYEMIHPIGSRHPVEIATARYMSGGTLSFTMKELWNEEVWQQLAGLEGTDDLLTVWERLAQTPAAVTCQMVIKPPGGGPFRGKVYHNCVVVEIPDGESVQIGSLSVDRTLVVAYTHATPLRAAA